MRGGPFGKMVFGVVPRWQVGSQEMPRVGGYTTLNKGPGPGNRWSVSMGAAVSQYGPRRLFSYRAKEGRGSEVTSS